MGTTTQQYNNSPESKNGFPQRCKFDMNRLQKLFKNPECWSISGTIQAETQQFNSMQPLARIGTNLYGVNRNPLLVIQWNSEPKLSGFSFVFQLYGWVAVFFFPLWVCLVGFPLLKLTSLGKQKQAGKSVILFLDKESLIAAGAGAHKLLLVHWVSEV